MIAHPCQNCGLCLLQQRGGKKKFCSISCQHIFARMDFEGKWMSGAITGTRADGTPSQFIKSILMERQRGCCSMCDLSAWMGQAIPLELDHKDGNGFNNSPFNVRLICSNCHSTTPTYKGRNRGNGRLSRCEAIMVATS